MIDLSIVVVTWNTRELVLECLASIEAELRCADGSPDLATETCVVDNGSTDGTLDAIRQRFPWVRVVSLARNVGFAAGSNAGLRALRGRDALLLNSDARLVRGVLARCVALPGRAPRRRRRRPAAAQSRWLEAELDPQLPDAGDRVAAEGHVPVSLPPPLSIPRWTGDAPIDVEAVAGAALFLRARLLREVGPLPEDYFFFLEETDWCLRVRSAGWRVVHLPAALVVHLSGGSSKRRSPAPTRIEYHRSLYRFFRKHHGPLATALVSRCASPRNSSTWRRRRRWSSPANATASAGESTGSCCPGI